MVLNLNLKGEKMAKVHIKNENKTIELKDNSCLVELEGKTNIIFACKVGACGVCIAKIVKGMENLAPPNEIERMYLSNFGSSDKRLLCQAVIKSGEVTIEY